MKSKTKQNAPTTDEWKRLYELAAELKKLAPWQWMDETEIFGVENPDTREIGFVSTMGMAGEHLSIGVYLSAEGLYGFWDFQIEGIEAEPFALFEIPQLQVSFENRENLEKQDRDSMKKLDLKFRGAKNYPLFRSIKSGFMPWFITSDEARFLIYAIEQTLEVAPRVRENADILDDDSDTENEVCLVRAAEKKDGKLVWRDEMREIPPPAEKEFIVKIPQALIDELKAFPQAENFILEIDLFYSPTPVGEKGKRPYIPKMLLLADGRSGMIAGFKMIQPQEDELENYAELGRNIFESLQKLNARPQEIRVASDDLFDLLKGLNQQLNIKLRQTDDLRAIEAAKEGLFGFFGGSLF
jgi:hypothetical protein